MRKIQPLCSSIALLVGAAMASSSGVQAGAQSPQRGVQDITPQPASTLPSPIGSYYALVIGNNNYQHLNKLQTAVNDAESVARVLREDYGFSVTILRDANRQAIVTALNDYRRTLKPESSLLIYYAGHGFHDREAEEIYWLPVTAERDNNVDWISGADITSNVHAIPSRHILIISDSCYSGALSRDTSAGIDPLQRGAYLSKMLSSKSRHWMSSGSDEPVLDTGPGEHSVFAAALLDSMKREDDQFTAADLFQRFIQPRVGGGSAQTPQYTFIRNSGQEYGDFVFIRSKNTATGRLTELNANEMVSKARNYYAAQQYDQALPLFRDAANAGNRQATSFLGDMYQHGLGGLPRDDAQALSWYRKGADAGDGRSMASLGGMYHDGLGGLRKDDTEAVNWIRKAANTGDGFGMANLGALYQLGLGGLRKDYAQAVSWYRKAANTGDGFGMAGLGVMYQQGLGGLPKDDAEAVSWFRKAAKAGDGFGMASLGLMYQQGLGGLRKDDAQAVSWYRKAAEAGEGFGMANLGRMYQLGLGGLPKDDAEAVSWYGKAADAGNTDAMNTLAVMYSTGMGGLPKDDTQAVSWFRKAAEAGDGGAMGNLGLMYEGGRGGLAKDEVQALSWYRKAADAGDASAMVNLAAMYVAGLGGLPQDDAQAVSWSRKAADAGNSNGMVLLGFMYENGRGGFPKDKAQAISWYRKAADLGDEYGKQALGRLGITNQK